MHWRSDNSPGLRRLWLVSAWTFVLAAASGALFRWGMLSSFPFDLIASNIRHGHSHLMLMGWATPALMALMAARWPAEGARQVNASVCIVGWTAWALALLSFPAFLLYGYESVSIGTADLPIAAILSGMAIFAWYAYAAIYFSAHRGVRRTPAIRLWDLAVGALVISSVGAWAVAGLMFAGIDSPLWESTTVHFFVDLFGGGWLVLGTLGILRSRLELPDSINERVARVLIGGAVGFVFLVGLPRLHAPELWPLFGSVAAGLLAAGLALVTRKLWCRDDLWHRRVLLLLAVKIAMLASLAFPPLAEWGLRAGLRLFYLHIAFAGFVTIGLVVMAREQWGRSAAGSPSMWLVGTVALLVTMIPLTGLWPRALAGAWTFQFVFVGSVVATICATVACTFATLSNTAMERGKPPT